MPDKYVTNFNMADGTNVLVKDAQLTTEVNTVKGRVTTAEGNITTLQGNVTTLQGNVTDLQGADTQLSNRITANTNALTALPSIAKPLSERKFIFIGDSYDAGWTPDGTFMGWGERAGAVLKKTLGAGYWNQYYGGAGFGFANENQMSFYYQIKTVGDSMSTATKNSITDIVFGGGRNDVDKENSTINQGIQNCANYIASNFPNAHVWLFAIGWDRLQNIKSNLASVYYECYSRSVAYQNWSYRELYAYLQQKNYMGSDGKHPNSDGNYLLGNQIGNILCGSEKTDLTRTLPLYLSKGETATGDDKAVRIGNYINITFKRKSFTVSGISHSEFSDTGILIDNAYIMGSSASTAIVIPVRAVLTASVDNTLKFYETTLACKFIIYVTGDTSQVHFMAKHNVMNDDKTNYLLDNLIQTLEIEDQTITVPIVCF